jgi:osmotically-inducible protein OsmY
MNQSQEATRCLNPAEIEESARTSLVKSSYPSIRQLECRYVEGVMHLEGEVPNFFHKQLAQETVRKVAGVRQINNRIDVPA